MNSDIEIASTETAAAETAPSETASIETASVAAMQEQLTSSFLALCGNPDDGEAAARADEALHALDVLLATPAP
jgi:DNA-binding FadR family transcriptional regulator